MIRNTPNLRDKFDVIIFPPVGGSAQAIVSGIPMRGAPIPWKGSDVTPNMALSPDQSDDIRGGMGLAGVVNLQKFVEGGGLFIPITNCVRLPIDYGITSGVAIQDAAGSSRREVRFMMRPSPIGEVRLPMDTLKPCRSTSTRRRCFRWPLAVEAVALVAAVAKGVAAAGLAALRVAEP